MIFIAFILWLLSATLIMGPVCLLLAMGVMIFPNRYLHAAMWWVYVKWVHMLAFWVRLLIPNIRYDNKCEKIDVPFVVIANHYTWLDILVLYATVFSEQQAFVFVMKRSLIHLPVIGWVCWGVGHPLLYRGSARRKNKEILTKSTKMAKTYGYGIAIFPEGTRYVGAKPTSDYQCVLSPKSAGFEQIVKNMGQEVSVIDVTLAYQGKSLSVWDFFFRRVGQVLVSATSHQVTSVDAKSWLSDRWLKKDESLSQIQKQWTDTD